MQQALSCLTWLALPALFPRHFLPLLEELDLPTRPAVQATRAFYQQHIYTLQQLHERVPPSQRGDSPPYSLTDEFMFQCLGQAAFSLSIYLIQTQRPPDASRNVHQRQPTGS